MIKHSKIVTVGGLCFVFLRQGLTMAPWLSLNSVCKLGWPELVAILLLLQFHPQVMELQVWVTKLTYKQALK